MRDKGNKVAPGGLSHDPRAAKRRNFRDKSAARFSLGIGLSLLLLLSGAVIYSGLRSQPRPLAEVERPLPTPVVSIPTPVAATTIQPNAPQIDPPAPAPPPSRGIKSPASTAMSMRREGSILPTSSIKFRSPIGRRSNLLPRGQAKARHSGCRSSATMFWFR